MRQTALLCLGLLLAACGAKSPATPPVSSAALEIAELQPGAGSAIVSGQTAVVNYTGWLYEATAPETKGKQFDSSLTGGAPFRFTLGRGQVIQGWDQGVLGMKVGGRRRLTIPPDLAYGDSGAGGLIPPGATLVFDVDLLAIE
ncbi:MAG: FKBP-type peptidyl-prolyl cis-trans isomerase [Steroidobacteraceae bacterium]|jgi:FKBP-type peptidyl-prolyl cis-trans isomerase FkpA